MSETRYTMVADTISIGLYSVVDRDYRRAGKSTKYVAHKLSIQSANALIEWLNLSSPKPDAPTWIKAQIALGRTFLGGN